MHGFAGIDFKKVLETAQAVSAQFTRKGVPHVIVGGLAVTAYGYRRYTEDVDVLVPSFRDDIVKHGLRGEARLLSMTGLVGRSFTKNGVEVDILRPASLESKALDAAASAPIVDPDTNLPIVSIEALIFLKLLAGRAEDEGDIVRLVKLEVVPPNVRAFLPEGRRAEFDRLRKRAKAEGKS